MRDGRGDEAVGQSRRGVFEQNMMGVSDDARRSNSCAAQTLKSCSVLDKTGVTRVRLSRKGEWKRRTSCLVSLLRYGSEDPQVDGGRRSRLDGQTSRSEMDRDSG